MVFEGIVSNDQQTPGTLTLLLQRVGKYDIENEKNTFEKSILTNFLSVTLPSTLYAVKKVCRIKIKTKHSHMDIKEHCKQKQILHKYP